MQETFCPELLVMNFSSKPMEMLHLFLDIFKIPDFEPKYQITYQNTKYNTKYQALFKIPVLVNLVFKIPDWQPC